MHPENDAIIRMNMVAIPTSFFMNLEYGPQD